jgi:hypothetical protein
MSIYSDVDSRVQTFKGNPAALMKRLGMSNNLLDALALAKVKEMQESAKNKMIADMAQQQGQQPTVVEALQQEAVESAKSEVNPTQGVAQQATGVAQNNQRQQQAALKQIMQAMQGQGQQSPLMSGIAAAPGAGNVRMAGGGIVAFQAGGPSEAPEEETAEERRIREERERRRHGMSNWGIGRETSATPHALANWTTTSAAGPREAPPPPPAPRPEAPRPAAPTPRESGLAYLRQQAAQQAGPPDPLGLKYREQVQADISMDPDAKARSIREETERYLAGPKAEEEAKARAAEVERRRGTLAESERNAPRRELIQALIGAGGRTSGLGALTAAGASGLNAALREESARERGMRDIFDLEEQARGLEANRRGAAERASATGRTETTRARTSALSSAGAFLNNEERNRLTELQLQAEAIDRQNTDIREQIKLQQQSGQILDEKRMRDYNAAQERYRKIEADIERARNLPTGPYAAALNNLKNADASLKNNPDNKVAMSLRNSAAKIINDFESDVVERLARAQQDVDTMAKRAGIAAASANRASGPSSLEAEMRRRGLLQ